MKIVCIHGLAGSRRYFAELETQLQKSGFETESFDLPGFGELKNFNFDFRTENFIKFLDQKLEGEKDLVLLGHSAGGLLALKWTGLNPNRVKKLILLNTPFAENQEQMKAGLALNKMSWSFFLEFYPLISKTACNLLCQKGFMKYFHFLKPKFISEEIFLDYTKHTFSGLRLSLENIVLAIFAKPLLRGIKNMPILAIWGKQEQEIFHLNFTQPNIQKIEVLSGHHSLHERFDETKKEIVKFLQN